MTQSSTWPVRLAAAGDLDACAALYRRVGRDHFHWQDPALYERNEFMRIVAEETLWVAVGKPGLAGFLSYYDPADFVHLLFVDTSQRGRGVGSALLAHIRRFYGRAHMLKVDEANQTARSFYARLGYRIVDRGISDGAPWLRLESPA